MGRAGDTLQGLEALQGDAGGAGDKLQQPSPPLLIVGLHGAPEPLDDVAVRGAVFQPGVDLPVVNVDLAQAADDKLEVGRGQVREGGGGWGRFPHDDTLHERVSSGDMTVPIPPAPSRRKT